MAGRRHRAEERAQRLVEAPWVEAPERERRPERFLAIGDPQATAASFFRALEEAGALGDDGLLSPEVGLISIGDHFDFPHDDRDAAGREGLCILRWLAAHPREQVVLLAGNHDVARVMELVRFDDVEFRAARARAREIHTLRKSGAPEAAWRTLDEAFGEQYPYVPTPAIVGRDYSSYSEAQRALVMQLLLARRLRLAVAGTLAGGPVLLTHAAVTNRELEILQVADERHPGRIAAALNAFLDERVDAVRGPWERGERLPLDLAPLLVSGVRGHEGGGLLYHRPANPEREGADNAWSFNPIRPRRYHPHALPVGLRQVAGHTGHRKCLEELTPWYDAAAPEMHPSSFLTLRTLRASVRRVEYRKGIHPPEDGDAVLHLIDGTLCKAERIELLALDALAA